MGSVFKAIAPVAGKLIGGAVGGPAGAAIGGAIGSGVSGMGGSGGNTSGGAAPQMASAPGQATYGIQNQAYNPQAMQAAQMSPGGQMPQEQQQQPDLMALVQALRGGA